ncbi:hypothetical protein ACTXL8_05460 [Glutamicibacter arilaitensis]|uniref:hypothetical protein n=1 Tax=Glutamicibacter arilaitensis TaxID=256701 RepID=UPI003FBA159C
MSQTSRSPAEAQARRETRTIARYLAHLSKDASPLALAELHGKLGRAIAEIATTRKKES